MNTDPQTEDILIDLIDEPPQAMRSDIDRDEIFELAADIKKNGLINPITVRPRGDRFEVVAGHRRFLAHRYGGIPKIRCIVRELSDDEAFAIMTSENLKRESVNPVDEAVHVSRLLSMHGGDINKVAHIVGYSAAWVQTRAEIDAFPADIKEALRTEKIKLGVAQALAQITDDIDRVAVLEMALSQGASVVMAQYWLAQWRAGLFGHATDTVAPDSNMPLGERHVVKLHCAISDKDWPASEMRSVLVHESFLSYINGMREYLKTQPESTSSAPVLEESGV